MTEVSSKRPEAETRSPELFVSVDPGQQTSLRAARCTSCGRHTFPARTPCPTCGAPADPVMLAGPARLRVLTGVRAQPPGSLVAAPYDVGVAEFDEGICVIGLVVGPTTPGDQVVPIATEPYDGGRIFAFRRAGGDDG
jgi:uncharacterized OB-fold protein